MIKFCNKSSLFSVTCEALCMDDVIYIICSKSSVSHTMVGRL